MLIKNNERFDQSLHQLFKYFFEKKPCRQGKVIYFASFLNKIYLFCSFYGAVFENFVNGQRLIQPAISFQIKTSKNLLRKQNISSENESI